MAPAFTVRAREPSTLRAARRARRAPGAGDRRRASTYVARTMRTRLTRTGHTVHGLLDVGTTPGVGDHAPAGRSASPSDSLREAAGAAWARRRRRGAARASRRGRARDRDRRRDSRLGRAREGGGDAMRRCSAIARTPVADGARRAARGRGDRRHARGGRRARGGARRRAASAACCRRPTCSGSTRAARSRCATRSSARPTRTCSCARPGTCRSCSGCSSARACPPRDLGRVLSLQHDALDARLIDFSICAGTGRRPLAVGVARPRQRRAPGVHARLRSGQRAGLRDAARPAPRPTVDAYFARLGREVNDGLARCGFGVDNNGVLAGNRLWRMSKPDWLRTFDECLQRARRVAPDPRLGRVRLPPVRRRPGDHGRRSASGFAPLATIPASCA